MFIQQNEATASFRTFSLVVTSSDGVTPYNGTLSGSDLTIFKAGVSAGNLAGTATLTTAATGKYKIVLAQGDCDTLGELEIAVVKTGVQSIEYVFGQVVPWDPFDGVRLGQTALRSDAKLIGTVASGTITASSFPTNLTIPDGQLGGVALIRFLGNITAALAHQVQRATTLAGGRLSFDTGFSTAPAVGDQFVLVDD